MLVGGASAFDLTGLKFSYDFNNNTFVAPNIVTDYVGYFNLTKGNSITHGVPGFLNEAYNFSRALVGTAAVSGGLHTTEGTEAEGTFSAWIKPSSAGLVCADTSYVVLFKGSVGTHYVIMDTDGSCILRFNVAVGGGFKRATSIDISASPWVNTWFNVVGTWNKTDYVHLYVNTTEYNSSVVLDNTDFASNGGVYIGAYQDALIARWNGLIDNPSFWNRKLSVGEIYQLYNGGLGMEYPFANTVSMVSPANDSHDRNASVDFVYNFIQYLTGTNTCYLNLKNSSESVFRLNMTSSAITTTGTYNFSNPGLDEAQYQYFINCTDGTNVVTTPLSSQIMIDRTNPILMWRSVSTSNTTVYNRRWQNLTLNESCQDTYMFAVNASLWNGSNSRLFSYQQTNILSQWGNVTGNGANPAAQVNINSWLDGYYQYSLHCEDDHTAKVLTDTYAVDSNTPGILDYRISDGTRVVIEGTDASVDSSSTVREQDRYSFGFGYSVVPADAHYVIRSNYPIYYRGSLWSFPSFVTSDHWVDLNNSDYDGLEYEVEDLGYDEVLGLFGYGVTYLGVYDAIVGMGVSASGYSTGFESLGGLNIVEQNVTFYLNSSPRQVANLSVLSYNMTAAVLNWTWSPDTLQSLVFMDSVLVYNGTDYNFTKYGLVNTTTYHFWVWSYNNKTGQFRSETTTNNNVTMTTLTDIVLQIEPRDLLTNATLPANVTLVGTAYLNFSGLADFNITGIPVGFYSIIGQSYGYGNAYSVVNVTGGNTIRKPLYFPSGGSSILFTVTTNVGVPIAGAVISIARFSDGLVVGQRVTDSFGQASFDMSTTTTYVVTTVASGYSMDSKTITPSVSAYTIVLGTAGSASGFSGDVQGITYRFLNASSIFQNNTAYTIGAVINSSYYNITDCVYTLYNESGSVLGTSSCFVNQRSGAGNVLFITPQHSPVKECLNVTVLTASGLKGWEFCIMHEAHYQYEGDASMSRALRNMAAFSGSGWDSFGRILMGLLLLMIGLVATAGAYQGAMDSEKYMLIVLILLGILSYYGFLTINLVTDDKPWAYFMNQYGLLTMMVVMSFSFALYNFRRQPV